jgi:hypothetical protein
LAHFVPPQADETYISNIERDLQTCDPTPADSATSEPPLPADATPCNQMQHDSQDPEDVAPGLRDLPAMIEFIEQTPIPEIEIVAQGAASGGDLSRSGASPFAEAMLEGGL